jgi:hypothetical protein
MDLPSMGLIIVRSYLSGLEAGALLFWLPHAVGAAGRIAVYGAVVDRYVVAATFAPGSAGSAPFSGGVAGRQPARLTVANATAAQTWKFPRSDASAAAPTAARIAPNCANMIVS